MKFWQKILIIENITPDSDLFRKIIDVMEYEVNSELSYDFENVKKIRLDFGIKDTGAGK